MQNRNASFFRLLADNSPSFIGMCDINFIPFYVNAAGRTLIGIDDFQQFSKTPVQAFFFPEDRDFILNDFLPRVLREGRAETEIRFRHFKTGEAIWMIYDVFVLVDADGETVGLATESRDITERKRAERRERRRAAELQAILDTAPLGVSIALDPTGAHIEGNRALEEMFGVSSKGEFSKAGERPAAYRLFRGERELPARELPMQRALRGETVDGQILDVRRADGARLTAFARATPLLNDRGEVSGAVGAFLDISRLKRAEEALALAKAEAERANVAKSKFLAAASHDLRQPVQSLTLLLSLIKGQVKDKPKTADAVDMAKSAVDSLNSLLTGILDISKLDAGVVAPDIASVNLGEIIERLAKEYAPRAMAQGLSLRHVTSALWARTDANLMDRILRNLIENALRYTEKGGILIGLRRRGDKARLDLIDTGIGIPADKQVEIFEEFRQLHNPARDASRGLGLGLAIVSRLAHLLGAPVEVASRLGHSTRFSLMLPLDGTAAPAEAATPALEAAAGRILVIEDNTLIRKAYEMMLKDGGYETLSAASGEEALEGAAQAHWRFDAIIADHRLGSGMTGNATATEIARRAGRSFPTVLVTGDTAKERLAEISASGFITLHKPVEADDLLHTVQSLLEGERRTESDGAAR